MSLTVSKVLQSVYQNLGESLLSTATGGSTTTVVDSKLANTSRDNVWREGILFISRDAGGAAASPEGQFQRVSGYTNSSGTFTVDTAFTTSPALGDLYMVSSSYYPVQNAIQALNEALGNLGDLDLVDTTTLDTIDLVTEYDAAVAWKRARPYRIDVQTLAGVTDDNQWREVRDWDWVPAAAGSTGLIVFANYQYPSRDIRVWYRDTHPAVYNYSDVIHEAFDPELVKTATLAKIYEWQVGRTQGADEFMVQRLARAEQQMENRKVERPTYRVKRGPKLLIVGGGLATDDDLPVPG